MQLLRRQAMFAVVLITFALIKGTGAATAVGLGAGIAVVGNSYFVLQAFRYAGAGQASQIVRSFYKGEAGKFVITVLLFAAVFAWVKPLQVGWLLTGFILEQLVVWSLMLSTSTGSKQ
jgi:ATP synthase protein I